MKRNMGKTDRILRTSAGVIILGAGLVYSSWWGLLGIIPLATGIVGVCPLYSMLGISTCPKDDIKLKNV